MTLSVTVWLITGEYLSNIDISKLLFVVETVYNFLLIFDKVVVHFHIFSVHFCIFSDSFTLFLNSLSSFLV